MRKKIIRRAQEVAAIVIGLAAIAGVTAGTGAGQAHASGGTTCQSVFPGVPPVRHVVRTGQSLGGWAATHHASVSNILEVTVRCEGGDWNQVSFVDYLDHGNLRAPLARGTVLWTHPVVPFKTALTAYAVPQAGGYYSADHAFCHVFPANFIRARNTRGTWAPKIPPTAPATRSPASAFSIWVKRHPHGTLAQSGHLYFNAFIRCYPVVR
jgi:hypothetical protein